MKLDLRRPTLVLTGAWNAAIFQPGWALKFLFEVPEGTRIATHQLIEVGTPSTMPITYVGKLGYRASNARVEFYLNELDAEMCGQLERMVLRLIATLPHTPFGSFGVNFLFIEEDPSDDLLDSIATRDALTSHYTVKSQELAAAIDVGNSTTLNLRRQSSSTGVVFNFNYDTPGLTADNAQRLLADVLTKSLKHATTLLDEVYALRDYAAINHEFAQGASHVD